MEYENEALGFYLSSHPIQAYRTALNRLAVVPSQKLADRLGPATSTIKIAGLVSKIKIRTSDRGRFAFVTMSDETGVFEMAIFKEDLLDRYRPLLEGGALIVAVIDGKKEDAGTRMILKSLQTLEEAIEPVKTLAAPKKLRVTLDSESTVQALKRVIGEPNGKGTQLTLCALLDTGMQAEIQLPGQYMLTPNMLMQIPTLEGVRECSEAA
jgi:DNA polymerase-3 subunit alpha